MHADVDLDRLMKLRLVAQRRGGPDYRPPAGELTPDDVAAIVTPATLACSRCGNALTIVDRGTVCRQCRLTTPHRAN